jgi:hypothetical protein
VPDRAGSWRIVPTARRLVPDRAGGARQGVRGDQKLPPGCFI